MVFLRGWSKAHWSSSDYLMLSTMKFESSLCSNHSTGSDACLRGKTEVSLSNYRKSRLLSIRVLRKEKQNHYTTKSGWTPKSLALLTAQTTPEELLKNHAERILELLSLCFTTSPAFTSDGQNTARCLWQCQVQSVMHLQPQQFSEWQSRNLHYFKVKQP